MEHIDHPVANVQPNLCAACRQNAERWSTHLARLLDRERDHRG
jgi:hypothetical protein